MATDKYNIGLRDGRNYGNIAKYCSIHLNDIINKNYSWYDLWFRVGIKTIKNMEIFRGYNTGFKESYNSQDRIRNKPQYNDGFEKGLYDGWTYFYKCPNKMEQWNEGYDDGNNVGMELAIMVRGVYSKCGCDMKK
jgi:hypothetical protein